MSYKGNNSPDNDINGNPGEEKSGERETAARIDELITQDRVVIFSKPTCPYCDKAKTVFDKLGQSYSTVDLSDHPKDREVQDVLKEKTGAGTVPRVFVDGVCIGGGNDTMQLYQNGQLEKILRQRSEDSMKTGGSPSHDHRDEDYGYRGSGEKFY